jgi:tetratricopeptide (TPR) repeat protein
MKLGKRPLVAGIALALAVLLVPCLLCAQSLTEQERMHKRAFLVVKAADNAVKERRADEATKLYAAALDLYRRVAQMYPGFRKELVDRRISYCQGNLAKLLRAKPSLRKGVATSSKVAPKRTTASAPLGRDTSRLTEAQLRSEIVRLRGEVFELSHAQGGGPSTLELKRRSDDLDKSCQALQSELTQMEDSQERMQKSMKALEKKYSSLEREKQALEREKQELEVQNVSLGDKVRVLRLGKEEPADVSTGMRSPPADQKELSNLRSKLDAATAGYNDLLREYRQLKAIYEEAEKESRQFAFEAEVELPASTAATSRRSVPLATQLMREGKLDTAREVIANGLEELPGDYELRLINGMLLCKEGGYEEAIEILKDLVGEDPSCAQARVSLGVAHMALGDYLDARMQLEMAVGFAPDLSEARYDLAQVLLVAEPTDPVGAMDQYKEALRLGAARDIGFERRLRTALAAAKARQQ